MVAVPSTVTVTTSDAIMAPRCVRLSAIKAGCLISNTARENTTLKYAYQREELALLEKATNKSQSIVNARTTLTSVAICANSNEVRA